MPIKLKQLLTEALDNLYHATEIGKALQILNSDAIKFTYSDSVGAEEKLNRGFPFYLSTSREKYGGYARCRTNNASLPVILVLDAKALERTRGIKMFDVDYWGKDYETPENLRHAETEERVVSDHQAVKGVKRYIQEMHVYVFKRALHDDYRLAIYRGYVPLAMKAKEMGIPTYFYIEGVTDHADPAFRQQRKSMAINGDMLIQILKEIGVYDPAKAPNDAEREMSRWEASDVKDLETLAKVINSPEDFVRIDYSKDKELYNLMDYFTRYQRDLISHFGTKIHNLRGKHPEVFQDIAKAIRGQKYKNFKQAVLTTSEILMFLTTADRQFKTGKLEHIVNSYQLERHPEARREVARYLTAIKDESELIPYDLAQLAHIFRQHVVFPA